MKNNLNQNFEDSFSINDIDQLDRITKKLFDEQNEAILSEYYNFLKNNKSQLKYIWGYNGILFLFSQILIEPMQFLKIKSISKKDFLKLDHLFKILKLFSEDEYVKMDILKSKLQHLIFPFLTKGEIYDNVYGDERLKMSALGVFLEIYKDGLISVEGERVFEIMPLILQVLRSDNQNVRNEASTLLLLIIQSDIGFGYAVQTPERFEAIHKILYLLIEDAKIKKNIFLLRNILKIYIRLCEKVNVRNKLQEDGFCEELHAKELFHLIKFDFELQGLQKSLLKMLTTSTEI